MGRSRAERLQVMLSVEEIVAIDEFRFRVRMPTRTAAVRELLKRGLDSEKGTPPKRQKRPFRVKQYLACSGVAVVERTHRAIAQSLRIALAVLCEGNDLAGHKVRGHVRSLLRNPPAQGLFECRRHRLEVIGVER
jgi:hypothetical protein